MVDRYLCQIKKRVISARAGENLALEAIQEIRDSLNLAERRRLRPPELADLYGNATKKKRALKNPTPR